MLIVLLGGVLLTWPEPPMAAIGIAAVAIAVFMPIFFLPFSKTVWLASDLLMRPLEAGEVAEGSGPSDKNLLHLEAPDADVHGVKPVEPVELCGGRTPCPGS